MTTYTYSLRFDITPHAASIIMEQDKTEPSACKRAIFDIVLKKVFVDFEIEMAIASLEHPDSNAHFQCCIWSPVLLTHKIRNKIGTLYHKLDLLELRKKDPKKKKDQIFSLTKARKPLQLANYCLKEDSSPILLNINDDFLAEIKKHVSIKALNNRFLHAVSQAVQLDQVGHKKILYFDYDSGTHQVVRSPEAFVYINNIHVDVFGGYITRRKYWNTLHKLKLISDYTYCLEMGIFRNI